MKDIFEGRSCTFYKHSRSNAGVNKPILDILSKEGYTNAVLLNKLRLAGYGSDFYKENKLDLSCATFSSIQKDLTVYHSEKNHLMHTGMIQFDIDAHDNEILNYPGGHEDVKNEIINKSPFVAYIGASVSRKGMWGLIAIAYPSRHTEHYNAALEHFRSLGIKPDDKTKNIASFRFLAYDPDAYFDLNAECFEGLAINNTKRISESPSTKIFYAREIKDEKIFLAACRWVEAKHEIKFETGSKHNYIVYLCACLISAKVSYDDATNWIHHNLISSEEITTNCIEHTYRTYT